jgi:hypothetical protein
MTRQWPTRHSASGFLEIRKPRIIWLGLLALLLCSPVEAQTIRQYDRTGNHTGNLVTEPGRTVQRDLAGNAHGYWVKEGDSIAHRSNNGNLIGTVRRD